MIRYPMPVNGTYYVVEAIPDSKAKNLAVVSAYMSKEHKKGNTLKQVLNLQGKTPSGSGTSETMLAMLDTSDFKLPQNSETVNTQNNPIVMEDDSTGDAGFLCPNYRE